jgi:hypothetical protein
MEKVLFEAPMTATPLGRNKESSIDVLLIKISAIGVRLH